MTDTTESVKPGDPDEHNETPPLPELTDDTNADTPTVETATVVEDKPKLSLEAARQLRSPAEAGYQSVEVAERSADVTTPTADEHVKVFVVGPGYYGAGFDHEPNKRAVRQYAISAGLRPTGDVRFVSATTHEDKVSKRLKYAVPVVPVSIAEGAATVHTVVSPPAAR